MKKDDTHLSVVQINTYDIGGGAEKMAYDLCRSLKSRPESESTLLVGRKHGTDSTVLEMQQTPYRNSKTKGWFTIGEKLMPGSSKYYGPWLRRNPVNRWAQPQRLKSLDLGHEDFDYPAIRHLEDQLGFKPDLIHLHNLHGDFFDLTYLPELSRRYPVVWTLHDMWSFTGHCAYSLDCDRWKHACGSCPHINVYPPLETDGTAFNLQRKADIYSQSHLYITAPSQWLTQLASNSILAPAARLIETIHNGISQDDFHPMPKDKIRAEMGIHPDALVLLFSAWGVNQNPYKDYDTVRRATEWIGQQETDRPVLLLALGSAEAAQEKCGHAEVRLLPYQTNTKALAEIYNAADIYLHAANAENFPLAVLEAMACGLPVIATEVGGVPEQITTLSSIQHSQPETSPLEATGLICHYQDPVDMAQKVMYLASHPDLLAAMGHNASEAFKNKYELALTTEVILDYYYRAIEDHRQTFPAAYL